MHIFKSMAALSAIFFTCIIVPVLLFWVSPGKHSDSEYRELVKAEDIISAPLSQKPDKITEYVEDNAPFREELNVLKSITGEALSVSSNDSVIIGSDNWLFLTDSVKWHTPETKLSAQQLKAIAGKLDTLGKKLNETGTRLVLFIAPDKESLYSEYLPSSVRLSDTNTAAIINALSGTSCEVYYYRDELLPYKDKYPLFAKYDTHWTSVASYISTYHLIRSLGSENPSFESLSMYAKEFDGNDLARLISMEQYLPTETDYDYAGYGLGRSMPSLYSCDINGGNKRYHTDGALSKKVAVLGDSFFNSMEPFFTIAFEETLINKTTGYNSGDALNTDADIFVIELCERNLSMLAYFNF